LFRGFLDLDGDGIKTGTGWVSADDGMLVMDRNGNGSIDTGRELFGDSTLKSNGNISSADAQFTGLQIWRDLNQDGISQGDELFTLNSLGIASISTAQTANSQTLANKNQIAGLGTYTRTDGSTGTSGDMSGRVAAQQRGTHRPTPCGCNLAADTFHREFTSTLDTSTVCALPDMQGSGVLRDLRQAATQSATLQNLLTQYSAATTREAQLALLDQLLDAWADTGGMAESLDERMDDGGALKAANDGVWRVAA
jgi:hypothetical protein